MVRISIPTLPPAPLLPPNALTKLPVREAAAYLARFLEKGKAAAAGISPSGGDGAASGKPQAKVGGIGTVLITGAGVSVDSGIRAYRGKEGHYSNPNYKPILYHELVEETPRGEMFRKRYWARSFLGYPPVRDAKPNPTHIYVAALQMLGLAPNLITQNVDNLHPKALTLLRSHLPPSSSTSAPSTAKPIRSPGDIHRNLSSFTAQATKSKGKDQDPTILELHGTLAKVHCLKARHERARDEYQEELADRNPVWQEMAEEAERTGVRPRTNPDGDVELHGVDFSKFTVPPCPVCAKSGEQSQVVKPNVVFFGETLAPHVKDESLRLISEASQLLVLGTSLATYSAFRLVKQAAEQGKPVLMISTGPSRADKLEGVEKMDRRAGEVLRVYLEELIKNSSGPEVEAVKACLDMGVVTPPPEVEGPRAEG